MAQEKPMGGKWSRHEITSRFQYYSWKSPLHVCEFTYECPSVAAECDFLVSELPSGTFQHSRFILWTGKWREPQHLEKGEIILKKSNLIRGKKNQKDGRKSKLFNRSSFAYKWEIRQNYILVPVRIHMPNYNIFIKWECNFHKGDYKLSTRSGKALFVLCISLGWRWWCGSENDLCSLALLGDYIVDF